VIVSEEAALISALLRRNVTAGGDDRRPGRITERLRKGGEPWRVADRGDDPISSWASNAGQPGCHHERPQPVSARWAPSTARRGDQKGSRPGSASRRVRLDQLVPCRRLVAGIPQELQNAVVRTIAVRRHACFVLGQRPRKSRAASSIWRSTIGLRIAPRAGSLARAERPSGVAAKDASACNSLASNSSTIALVA
jgi:hypothetical protein